MIEILYKLFVVMGLMTSNTVMVDDISDVPQYALDNFDESNVHRELVEKTPELCNDAEFVDVGNNTILVKGGCFGIGIRQNGKNYVIANETYSYEKYEWKRFK